MNERISNCLVTLGFTPNNIEQLHPILSFYRNLVASRGVTPQNIKELHKLLFRNDEATPTHSCCLDLHTLRLENDGLYSAWIDRGGLYHLHKKISEDTPPGEFYDLPNFIVEFPEYTSSFFVVAFDLEGNVLLNTHQMFDNIEDQNDEYHRLGKHDYLALLLNTIKTNAEKFRLPRVPKGILKLPESIQCATST
jgi:hypothetical protein